MSRKIAPIKVDLYESLPARCQSCVYWEFSTGKRMNCNSSASDVRKQEWFKNTLFDWGCCGRLLLEGRDVLAYTQYAPPVYFSQIGSYSAGPINPDAIFLSCLYVAPEVRGRSLGKLLLQSVVKDLYKRKHKALETFASKTSSDDPAGPLDFYLEQGFRVFRDDPEYPLLRLEFASIARWQENLEKALEGLKLPVRAKAPLPL